MPLRADQLPAALDRGLDRARFEHEASAAVRERAEPASLAELPIRLPAPVDMLLHLCQHTGLNAFS